MKFLTLKTLLSENNDLLLLKKEIHWTNLWMEMTILWYTSTSISKQMLKRMERIEKMHYYLSFTVVIATILLLITTILHYYSFFCILCCLFFHSFYNLLLLFLIFILSICLHTYLLWYMSLSSFISICFAYSTIVRQYCCRSRFRLIHCHIQQHRAPFSIL